VSTRVVSRAWWIRLLGADQRSCSEHDDKMVDNVGNEDAIKDKVSVAEAGKQVKIAEAIGKF